MTARRWGLLLACLLVAASAGAGCARGDPGDDPFRRSSGVVEVLVRNQHELAVILHAYGPGSRMRLGSLEPGRTRTYRVPWTRADDLRIRVEPPTGPGVESNSLLVRPGDRVLFTVASEVGRSVLIYR